MSFNSWQHQIENEELEGSGFAKQSISQIEVEIFKINNLSAGTYVELPFEAYKNSKSIINIKNIDQLCFYRGVF